MMSPTASAEWGVHFDSNIYGIVMRHLSAADKAALAASCRSAREAWKTYPFSADDYGSTVAHKNIGPAPEASQWLAMIRDRHVTMSRCPDLARQAREQSGCSEYYNDLKRQGECSRSPESAQMVLMRLSCLGGFPERDPNLWAVYGRCLTTQGRHSEALPFADKQEFQAKKRMIQELGESLTKGSVCAAERLVEEGVPIKISSLRMRSLLDADSSAYLQSWIVRQLSRKPRRQWDSQRQQWELWEAVLYHTSVENRRHLELVASLENLPRALFEQFVFEHEKPRLEDAILSRLGFSASCAETIASIFNNSFADGFLVLPKKYAGKMTCLLNKDLLSTDTLVEVLASGFWILIMDRKYRAHNQGCQAIDSTDADEMRHLLNTTVSMLTAKGCTLPELLQRGFEKATARGRLSLWAQPGAETIAYRNLCEQALSMAADTAGSPP